MKYETVRSRMNPEGEASYHCGFDGCSVRYDPADGYYMVLAADGHVYRLEEPGVNTLKCPVHSGWLYRQENMDSKPGVLWGCGAEDCSYCFEALTKGDWVRT